ncbi:hypothetical protein BU15DRAFT_74961 [Melanogaster broomeanus]|nr:hypothetical protein BU15DRAFT_74961 [Melanogaster broomeanus]
MGPGTGVFRIISAVGSSLWIGVDNTDSPGTQRVVSYGDMAVWYLHEDSGKYKIDLVTNWYSKEEYGNLVVQTPVDPGTRWIITETSPDTFTIESDSIISPNTAWTLTSTERKYPVNLEYITPLPHLEQQWRFEPIMERTEPRPPNNPTSLTQQPTTMAPGTGRFMIISVVPPSLSIGADNIDNSATKDVLSDGEMRVWSLKEEGNVYKIVLDENWYSTNEKDNVAVQTSVDPGTRWVISQVSPDEFRIETATPILPNMAWTLTGDNPKSSVVLRSTLGGSDPHQYWRFVPVLED